MSHYRSSRLSDCARSEEARTPIAWQHRDINYHRQGYTDRYRPDHAPHQRGGRRGPASVSDQTSHTERSQRSQRPPREAQLAGYRGRPPPQRSDTSSASSEASQDTQIPTHAASRHGGGPAQMMAMSGGPPTLRSAQSVPLLLPGGPAPLTWDGEPCPVHHHHPGCRPPLQMALPAGPLSLPVAPPSALAVPRAASMYDLRVSTPFAPPPGAEYPPGVMTIDRRSMLGLVPVPAPMSVAGGPGSTLGGGTLPPGALLPPMMRPRPIVRAEDGATRELPVRDPQKPALVPSPPSSVQKEAAGCGGLRRVLAISLAMIVLGVCLAVALFFVIN